MSEKGGLKLNIQKTKIMASSPITLWQIEGEKVDAPFLFSGAPKSLGMITAAIKFRCLLLGRKATTNLDSIIKKQRHHNANKGPYIVKAMVFPAVMYGCEGWTIKRLSTEEMMPLNCGAEVDS